MGRNVLTGGSKYWDVVRGNNENNMLPKVGTEGYSKDCKKGSREGRERVKPRNTDVILKSFTSMGGHAQAKKK